MKAHGPAEPPPPQFHFDRFKQVVCFFFGQSQVGIADHPEPMAALYLHAGEELGQERGNDLLHGDEARVVRKRQEPRQKGRDLDPGKTPLAALRVTHHHRQVEREVGYVGERVARIDTEGCQDGEHLGFEDGLGVGHVLGAERAPRHQAAAAHGQAGDDHVVVNARLLAEHPLDFDADGF